MSSHQGRPRRIHNAWKGICKWLPWTTLPHFAETGSLAHNASQWRHNDRDSVSNQQPHGCLRNRLFRRRSKKTSKLRVTGLCVGNSPGPVNFPHKGPVTRKMFPFVDVIMGEEYAYHLLNCDPCNWISTGLICFPSRQNATMSHFKNT